MTRRSTPPLWFSVLVAVVAAVCLRAILPHGSLSQTHGGDGAPPQQAFWFVVMLIASAIWKGVEVAGRITLQILAWSVKALWWFATTTYNGLKFVGAELLKGLKRAWDFFKLTYDKVLKPAWEKFWKLFDRVRNALDKVLAPVFKVLRKIRTDLLAFYTKYVRPVLDVIEATRRVAHLLADLHVPFAQALDRRLQQLEELIDKPFRLVLAKVNEIINAVNRIATLDGLLQRVALIRSMERDVVYAWRTLLNSFTSSDDDALREHAKGVVAGKTYKQVVADVGQVLTSDAGADAPIVDEWAAQWRIYLRS